MTDYQYFGARYYNSDISVWLSVDSMSDARLGLSPYNYSSWNPIMRIDPTGMLDDWIDKDGNKISDEERKKVKVFIFYQPGGSDADGFEEQAKEQYDYYEEKYGKGSVALSDAKTNEEFLQDWKDISGEDTKLVILDYHGDSQWIGLPNGSLSSVGDKTAELKNKALDINKLPMPSGNISKAKLQINSCHSNESTSEGKNVVQAFKDNFFSTNRGFKYIRGASGSVSYPFGGAKPFSYWTWSSYRRPSFNSASQIDWDAINDFPW